MKYARVLLGHCPQDTTQLFITFYTGKYRPKKDIEPPSESQTPQHSAVRNLAAFIPLPYVGASSATKSQPSEPQLSPDVDDTNDFPTWESKAKNLIEGKDVRKYNFSN